MGSMQNDKTTDNIQQIKKTANDGFPGFPACIPKSVRNILKNLEKGGYEAWCVGGCVRDLLLGRTPHDWDVTTSALPEEVGAVFRHRSIPTGLKHGTLTVLSGPDAVEVTTYRCDGDYVDHRRPASVSFTRSLEEDLRRRDFTVNAMALSLRGELRDPFGGREDLREGVLRRVGDPDARFNEDALRLMRALRFSAVLGFPMDPETAAAVHTHRELLSYIAAERVQSELLRLLAGERAAAVLRAFPDVIGVFWPEILPCVGFDQRNVHHCYDVWEHTLHAMEASRGDPVLRCALLLHDIGKPRTFTLDENGTGHFHGHGEVSREMAEEMLRRLRCSNAFRAQVVQLVAWHDRAIPLTEKAVRKALEELGEGTFRMLLEVKRADNLAQAPAFRGRQRELERAEEILNDLLERKACLSLKQLAVNGRDMLELGLSGPSVGAALDNLLSRVLTGQLPNERAALLRAGEKLVVRREKRRRKNRRKRDRQRGALFGQNGQTGAGDTARTGEMGLDNSDAVAYNTEKLKMETTEKEE